MTTTSIENDPIFSEACNVVQKCGSVNISLLQRHLKIGYDRASALYQHLINEKVLIGEPDEENYRKVNPEYLDTFKIGNSY